MSGNINIFRPYGCTLWMNTSYQKYFNVTCSFSFIAFCLSICLSKRTCIAMMLWVCSDYLLFQDITWQHQLMTLLWNCGTWGNSRISRILLLKINMRFGFQFKLYLVSLLWALAMKMHFYVHCSAQIVWNSCSMNC